MPRGRLSPQDWSHAALEAIAEGGVSAVAVEALASRVGASKGSFYWHFADRAALIEAAALDWEQDRTTEIIDALGRIEDPRERLRTLFLRTFRSPQAGRIEAALGHIEDRSVSEILERVTAQRLAFLADALGELGLEPRTARSRALVAYSTIIGLYAVRAADALPDAEIERFADELLELLTAA